MAARELNQHKTRSCLYKRLPTCSIVDVFHRRDRNRSSCRSLRTVIRTDDATPRMRLGVSLLLFAYRVPKSVILGGSFLIAMVLFEDRNTLTCSKIVLDESRCVAQTKFWADSVWSTRYLTGISSQLLHTYSASRCKFQLENYALRENQFKTNKQRSHLHVAIFLQVPFFAHFCIFRSL